MSTSKNARRRWGAMGLVASLALAAGSVPANAEPTRRVASAKPFTTAQLVGVLRQAGYVDIEAESADQIHFKRSGQIFYLNRYPDGDLVLYFGLTGYTHLAPGDFNAWNREKRLTRAYQDVSGDAVLESDMLFDGGLTARKIAVWVNVFVGLVDGYEDFLRDRETANRALDPRPDAPPDAAPDRASRL